MIDEGYDSLGRMMKKIQIIMNTTFGRQANVHVTVLGEGNYLAHYDSIIVNGSLDDPERDVIKQLPLNADPEKTIFVVGNYSGAVGVAFSVEGNAYIGGGNTAPLDIISTHEVGHLFGVHGHTNISKTDLLMHYLVNQNQGKRIDKEIWNRLFRF